MKYIFLSLFLILLNSCATTENSQNYPPNSLAGNSSLPDKELKDFYGKKQWKEMRTIPYDAYAIIRGRVGRDDYVKAEKIRDSFPDNKRDELAVYFAEGIRSNTVKTGTRINSNVEVYVVFYEKSSNPNRALIFTKKIGPSAPTDSIGGSTYMQIRTY